MLLAGLVKLVAPSDVAQVLVQDLGLGLDWKAAVMIARAVGTVEICCGLLLCLLERRAASVIGALLLSSFLTFDLFRFVTGADASCACFGGVIVFRSWAGVAVKQAVMWLLFWQAFAKKATSARTTCKSAAIP